VKRHQGGESFQIDLRALADDDAPAHVRLRRLLKLVLRGFGFRCVGVRETTPALPPLPQGTPRIAQDETSATPATRKPSEEIPW
jgi:hypothetical protein